MLHLVVHHHRAIAQNHQRGIAVLLRELERLFAAEDDARCRQRIRVHGAFRNDGGRRQIRIRRQSRPWRKDMMIPHAVDGKAALVDAAGHDAAVDDGYDADRTAAVRDGHEAGGDAAVRLVRILYADAVCRSIRLRPNGVDIAAEIQHCAAAPPTHQCRHLVCNVALGDAAEVNLHSSGQRNRVVLAQRELLVVHQRQRGKALLVSRHTVRTAGGLEFTEQLKTNTATSHIPVIMLTAKNLEEHRAEGYEHGADSYITKPFHSKVLLARIENLLRQRQLLKNLYQGTKEAEKEISEAHLEDRDKQFLKQLQAIIQKNLSDSEFGVEDMGQQIGLSRVQLYRKVKAMTGSSVVDLLRKARLAKARRLLETRSMSVSEVAYEVGFSAPSYFTKCFKEEYGMLPGDVGNVLGNN